MKVRAEVICTSEHCPTRISKQTEFAAAGQDAICLVNPRVSLRKGPKLKKYRLMRFLGRTTQYSLQMLLLLKYVFTLD